MRTRQRKSDPQVSLNWRPDDSLALVTFAESQLSASQTEAPTQRIADMARRALRANPLEEGALRVLALNADREGQSERASALMALAAHRSMRDTKALVWLFNERVRENRPADALYYADAILRTHPELEGTFANALVVFASVPRRAAGAHTPLGNDPPWRPWFLGRLAAKASAPSITYTVLSGLASTPNPPRDSEVKPYLDRLIGDKQYQLAFLTWWHFLPPALRRTIPFVFNGDFELPINGVPFNWLIGSITGASTRIVDTRDKDHDHALQVVFANRRVPYRQVSKLLILPPGSYQLSGQVKADHLVNERGVVWRIFCADDTKVTLVTSAPVMGTSDWHGFAATFEVPATGCAAQWLRLELAARFPIEEQVSGAVWYDDLKIKLESGADAEVTSNAVH